MRIESAVSLIVAVILLPSASLAQRTADGTSDLPEIETVGSGEKRVPPDRATVMLSIETKMASAATAASANARVVAAVRDTLRKLGLDSATTTAGYHVGPHFEPMERERPRQQGYVARTTVRVALTRIDQVGTVIDAGLAKQATGVEGVYFEASTAEDARRAAMGDAALAARRDAESLARALGGSLGPLLSVSTASGMDPRRMNVMMSAGYARMARTEITPTELVIAAGVVTRWRFMPGGR